ncbi:MAG: protein translocase subunit SecF, partial [Propionibacterium sp.]|nr:protein translocase subunit SecF [Propionibacterium sp.]
AAEPQIRVSATTVPGGATVSSVEGTADHDVSASAHEGGGPTARQMRDVGDGRAQPVRTPRSKRKK